VAKLNLPFRFGRGKFHGKTTAKRNGGEPTTNTNGRTCLGFSLGRSFLSKMTVRKDYWDIEELLAEEESVPAVFSTTVHQMGFLDQASEEEDVSSF
jgi:hypothetical protein